MTKTNLCLLIIGGIAALLSYQFVPKDIAEAYHSEAERLHFAQMQDSLPVLYNGLFAGSGRCVQCHGADPEGIASVTFEGQDVNVVDDWSASIMGNSGRDPYWRAKVRETVLNNLEHQEVVEDKCTSCHAPLARFSSHILEGEMYSMENFDMDSLAIDGVSCLACHQQTPTSGSQFSGELEFETDPIAYGPFISPLISTMVEGSGYEPRASDHISKSEVCAGCHTLITETIDLDGEYVGSQFVEQATYHEWLNSTYAVGEVTMECQGCHMPDLGFEQPVQLIAGFETPARAPFSLHHFRGVNTHMLNILKDNTDELGVAASEAALDESIDVTSAFMRNQSMNLSIEILDRTADTLIAKANLTNLAGHKYPSGYPARRLFLNIQLTTENGTVLFENGTWDSNYYLNNEDDGYEPHYDKITNEGQIQIYEMVMGDVNGDYTSLLERGYSKLKDNRLVPQGFTSTHSAYDTTYIAGLALEDNDFNMQLGVEGSGTDEIELRLPTLGSDEPLILTVNAYYQAIPPKFLDELFDFDDPLIDTWQNMYDASDKTPFLVRSASDETGPFVGIQDLDNDNYHVFYSVAQDELVVKGLPGATVSVYSTSGQLLIEAMMRERITNIQLDASMGVCIVIIQNDDSKEVHKVHIQR